MEIDKTKVLVVLLTIALAAVLVLGIGVANRYSESALDNAVAKAKIDVRTEYQNQLEETEILFQKQIDEKVAEYEEALANKTAELEAKEAALEELNEKITAKEEEEIVESSSYLIASFLGDDFEATLDSYDLSKLVDKKIRYDKVDYLVEEKLFLSSNVKPLLNLDDFGAEVALGIMDEEGIVYKYMFDEAIVVADKELEIDFLGQPLTIVNFDGTELEYRTSVLFEGSPDDEKEVEGKTVTIKDISDDAVIVVVDGKAMIVNEGDVSEINGLRVEVVEIFASEFTNFAFAKLYVGEEISEIVKTNDEYEADDRYEWIIGDDFIGVKLIEKFVYEDEAFKVGDSISLPHDYVTFTFKEVRGLDYQDVKYSISGGDLDIVFDGKIEVDGKRIDSAELEIDLDTLNYSYVYKGDDYTSANYSAIAFVFDDRDDFTLSVELGGMGHTRVILTGDAVYEFAIHKDDRVFFDSRQDASEMNEDEDYLLASGDLLYKSDVNEEDGTKKLAVGLVKDTTEVEAIVAVI